MSSEVEVAGVQFPPGIYHIAVASHGRFTHERLTDREYVTITPPSARPDPRQLVMLRLADGPRLTIAHQAIIFSGKSTMAANMVPSSSSVLVAFVPPFPLLTKASTGTPKKATRSWCDVMNSPPIGN